MNTLDLRFVHYSFTFCDRVAKNLSVFGPILILSLKQFSQIRLFIKDLIGQELSSALYSTLFMEIRSDLEGFFTSGGQVSE